MEKRLTADLNVVANSNLEIQLLDGDLNIIQKLDDEPNDVGGLTSAELKAKFDESGNIIKKYINETLIPAVLTDDATEESRKQAEAARVTAEQGRVTAEEGRVSAESGRVSAEQARSDAEASRVSAENTRKTAETARADAERTRANRESARETAETDRANAEAERVSAESTRASAETDRKSAEYLRNVGELGRKQEEATRRTAEDGRVQAEAARASAEQSRTSAEAAREAAEKARADETAGIVAQSTAQANAAAGSASQAAGSEQSAKDAADTATGAASTASRAANFANQAAMEATSSASQASAAATAAAGSAAGAETASKTAQSWAVGGTNTRPGEDTDNAKYWAEQAKTEAVVQPSSTTPKAPGEAAVGTEQKYARGDHVHPSDPTKQGINDEIQGLRLTGGINSIGSMNPSVAINPAVNGAGFARIAGATVRIYYDDYDMPMSDSEIDKLFDGRLGTYINFPQPTGDFVWNNTKTYPAGAYVTDQTHVKWYRALKGNTNVSPIDDTTSTWKFVSRAESGSYARFINLDNVTICIDVTFPSSIRYENSVSLYWRTTGQNASYIKVEKYDSNAGWFQVYEKSGIGSNDTINNIYMGADPSGAGTQKRLRITLKSRTGSNWFALSQIAITGLYGGIEGTLLNRGGGTMYGDVSPYKAGGASLGTASAPWKEVRAQTLYGDVSKTTATFTAAGKRENIYSGETMATIFGKLHKWLSEIKGLAFKDKVGTDDLNTAVKSTLTPTVSAADNGKFLRVVDGKWAASEISNANGGSF